MPTYALAGEMSGSHSGSRSVHVSEEDQDTVGVGGEVPHETGTLNAYIYISFSYQYLSFMFSFNIKWYQY